MKTMFMKINRMMVISLSFIICHLSFSEAQAQGLRFGVKGGYNITQMSWGSKVMDSSNKYGFFIGPTIKGSLAVGVGFDIAGLYDERTMEVDGEEIRHKTFNVPVNLRYNIGLGRLVGTYMTVGPQFSFTLGDKEFQLTDAYNTARDFRLRDAFMSVNMGAGIYVTKHLEVGVIYNIAVGRTGELKELTWDDALQSRASAWQLTASLFF